MKPIRVRGRRAPRYRTAVFAAVLSCTCVGALAHDYRLERDGDSYVLQQGHLYSAHSGEDNVAYDPAIVQSAHCLDDNGKIAALPRAQAYPFRVRSNCAAVAIQTVSGYWSQTLTGTVNKPKTAVTGALRSWLSQESIKRMDRWLPAAAAPLTDGLELVTTNDPFALKAGDKIRVQVFWRGQPRAGATVAYDGAPRGVSDADGKVNVRVRRGGTQVLSAGFEEPLKDPRADKVARNTLLQFQLPE